MKLYELVEDFYDKMNEELKQKMDVEINNLAFSLNDIKRDTLFFCLKTLPEEIMEQTTQAKKLGAVAIVSEGNVKVDLINIYVPSVRKALAKFSAKYYGNPANSLKVIGITGTNGKTTSTYILKSILEANGSKVGLIGTNGYMIGGYHYSLDMTTPDPPVLHSILKKMLEKNCEYVVMEVSAHALYFDKIEGIKFECGIFTNFTQDHLDFFKTLENYAYSKAKYFSSYYLKSAVFNSDDVLGRSMQPICNVSKIASYGINNPADVFAINIKNSLYGSNFVANIFDNVIELNFAIAGVHNVQNVLGCVTCAYMMGVPIEKIQKGVANLECVEGRFQVIPTFNDSFAVIDYAHTPDGLKQILQSVQKVSKARIITVFGCGGNRDRRKRSIMGEIAGENSDFCIITSDNPRFENPSAIISQIEKGLSKVNDNYICIENRQSAIEYALSIAEPNDCVVICGKGAEKYQEIDGIKYEFSDYSVVKQFCQQQHKQEYQAYEK